MKRLLFLLVAVATPLLADEAQLTAPQLTKPTTEAAVGDALHEKYEAAWIRYEKAVGEVREKVNAALDAQFEKAADAGNLDLADMWDKKKKVFADTGSVAWPSDGKTKAEWRKKHPTTEFPDDFSEVIAAAVSGYEKAVATLKDDYESLVKDYTKDRNLARAKALRDELAGLARKPVVAQERPKMVAKKPDEKKNPAVPSTGVELEKALLGTAWKNQNGFTFEWDSSGNVWHCKDGGRTPIKVSYIDGTKCHVEFINKAKQVLIFKKELTAFEQYNLEGQLVQSAIRVR